MVLRQLIANFILFLIGVFGVLHSFRSILLIVMCFELILLSAGLNFMVFSVYLDDIYGQLVTILALTVAAAESAIALAIIIFYNRQKNIISLY